jgi:hypothetical protein
MIVIRFVIIFFHNFQNFQEAILCRFTSNNVWDHVFDFSFLFPWKYLFANYLLGYIECFKCCYIFANGACNRTCVAVLFLGNFGEFAFNFNYKIAII